MDFLDPGQVLGGQDRKVGLRMFPRRHLDDRGGVDPEGTGCFRQIHPEGFFGTMVKHNGSPFFVFLMLPCLYRKCKTLYTMM